MALKTANHCEKLNHSKLFHLILRFFRAAVKLGEHNLETKIDCEHGQCADPPQIIVPKAITVPKEYDDIKLKHDLAIIELSEPANITRFVNPVCLPKGGLISKTLMDEVVEVAGWGWFDIDDPKSSPVLQFVRLPVVNIDECRKIKQLEHHEFSRGQICVGGIAGKGKQSIMKSQASSSRAPNILICFLFSFYVEHFLFITLCICKNFTALCDKRYFV